jgi:hypothetical protein
MPTLDKAKPEVLTQFDGVLRRYHGELVEAGVRFELLMAHARRDKNGQPKGPAVKLHGWPCKAKVKINNVQDRIEGKADVTITLDGDRWQDWSADEQAAILSHEATHVELKRDKGGFLMTDDAFRPALKMRPHDWELGGFAITAERFGQHAPEVIAARELADAYGQLLFDFDASPAAVRFPGAAREAS